MEVLVILLVYLGFGFALFKVAKSKNRNPGGWILAGVILSPIIVLIILAIMPSLSVKRKVIKKNKKLRK